MMQQGSGKCNFRGVFFLLDDILLFQETHKRSLALLRLFEL